MQDHLRRLWRQSLLWLQRPARLELDFARAQRQSPATGLALLALGALLLALVLWQSDRAENQVARLEVELGATRPLHIRPVANAVSGAELEERMRKANRVIRQFSTPWEDVFGSVESANGEHVALLSLESDPASAQVRVSAEARSFQKMLDYLEHLRRDGRLSPAILQSHQLMLEDPSRPVRFTFTASWTSATKAPN